MKQLFLLLLLIPTLLSAQEDQRYLAGSVPEVDGKVVFTKEFSAPSLSQDQIYDALLQWAEGYFNKETERIAYTNKEKGEIAVMGNTYIIFSSTALSLDRARMNYQVTIQCEGSLCKIKISAIRYTYDVAYQREPEKYTAEEFITDKMAISKKGKLIRGMGKFRKATIDYVDKTMESAVMAINKQYAVSTPVVPAAQAPAVVPATPAAPAAQATPATPAASVIPATPLQPSIKVMEGFVAISPDKIPNTIVQMLPDNKMVVTSDITPDTKEAQAIWKGIGNMFGKQVASFSVSSGSPVYKSIGNNGTYRISFIQKDNANNDVWMVLECRKQGETPDGQQTTVLGEIINVWVK